MRDRKDELIAAAIGYLLENGLADLSLRPLAAGVGSSARLLIYHFDSKEGLLNEVLEAMQARVRDSLVRLVRELPAGKKPAPLFRLIWDWAIAEENFPYLKRLYELHMLAIQNPATYAQYLERNALNWINFAMMALPASGQKAVQATLLGAVFDGLFLELMGTGDRKRTTRAMDYFIKTAGFEVKPPGRGRAKRGANG